MLEDSQTDKCWSYKECKKPFESFAACYEEAGPVTDPNSRSDQNKNYQTCLCKNEEFKQYVYIGGKVVTARV